MSYEFNDPQLAPEAIINSAIGELYEKQSGLFTALRACAQNPTKKTGNAFNENSIAMHDAFSETVGIIAMCEELPPEERAAQIATLCIETDEARIHFLQEVSPNGDFQENSTSHDQLSGMFEDFIYGDMDTQGIVASATSIYAGNLNADLSELFDSVEPSRKAKLRLLLKDAGNEALDAGKLTAAVVVGTLIAQRILKKFGD